MTERKSFPVLYILMRTDLDSMNPGKAVAQGSHAANHMQTSLMDLPPKHPSRVLFDQWQKETKQHFGTCLTLGVNEKQLRGAVEYAQKAHFAASVIHDPTYPLRDGGTTHFIPLDTCGWVFGDKNELTWLFTDLSLMP